MKSTVGFILALIGGILSIIAGTGIFVRILIARFIILNGIIPRTSRLFPFLSGRFLIILGLIMMIWLVVMGIIAILASIEMNSNNNRRVRNGGILGLVVGILSINVLTIIGGVFGIVDSQKNK